VEGLSVRLLPFASADGPSNMAADEVLVHTAARDRLASLRFYAWSPPTLSLGYFQAAAVRRADPLLAQLPWVRRPSGGATLVHHHELTYCLALPAGAWQAGEPWMARMHRVIVAALDGCGLGKRIALLDQSGRSGDVLCFERQTPGDVVCTGSKIVGSAQRKHRQALLQHGSILLARSPYTPRLPGLYELTGVALTAVQLAQAVASEFARETGWTLTAADWSEDECGQFPALAGKYRSPAWNEKR
jgi:lipoate-protein ligase A